jgi:hypothetical protein
MKGSRFLNQKLGKRTDRKSKLLKARLEIPRNLTPPRLRTKASPPAKGPK